MTDLMLVRSDPDATDDQLAAWPEHDTRPGFAVRLLRCRGDRDLECDPDRELRVVGLGGSALGLVDASGASLRVRPLEPLLVRSSSRMSCERGTASESGSALLVEVDPRIWRAEVSGARLGARRLVDELPGGGAHFVAYAAKGRVVARVSGEEEPFELERGDALWIVATTTAIDVELAGTSADASVATIRLVQV